MIFARSVSIWLAVCLAAGAASTYAGEQAIETEASSKLKPPANDLRHWLDRAGRTSNCKDLERVFLWVRSFFSDPSVADTYRAYLASEKPEVRFLADRQLRSLASPEDLRQLASETLRSGAPQCLRCLAARDFHGLLGDELDRQGRRGARRERRALRAAVHAFEEREGYTQHGRLWRSRILGDLAVAGMDYSSSGSTFLLLERDGAWEVVCWVSMWVS